MLLAGCDGHSSATTPKPNQLRGVTLHRDYSNARLVLEVALHNTTTDPAALAPPFIRLLDGAGKQIPPFFLAFNQPPSLAPGETGIHELAFWLEESDLAEELWLHVADAQRIAVKNARPFNLESIDNQTSCDLTGTDWAGTQPQLPAR